MLKQFNKINKLVCLLFLVSAFLNGCGQTIRGIGKDTSRIYRGTKMIFVSEEAPKKGFFN